MKVEGGRMLQSQSLQGLTAASHSLVSITLSTEQHTDIGA